MSKQTDFVSRFNLVCGSGSEWGMWWVDWVTEGTQPVVWRESIIQSAAEFEMWTVCLVSSVTGTSVFECFFLQGLPHDLPLEILQFRNHTFLTYLLWLVSFILGLSNSNFTSLLKLSGIWGNTKTDLYVCLNLRDVTWEFIGLFIKFFTICLPFKCLIQFLPSLFVVLQHIVLTQL